jgi:predicted kinase
MKPTAFFVIGPAGSGKSTVSKAIAQRYSAAYLDKDTMVTAFTELILQANGFDKNERDNNAFYQAAVLPIEYETLLRTCGDNLRVGTSVVLDAPFGRYFAERDYLESARRQYGWPDAELIVVHVKADSSRVLDRLVKRHYSRDTWKIEHWEQFWNNTQHAECHWDSAHHLVFENNNPILDLTRFDQEVKSVINQHAPIT